MEESEDPDPHLRDLGAFGPHLTIDAAECELERLADAQLVYDVLDQLPAKMGMTKITLPYVVKWQDKWSSVPGFSGFVMIAESHISIHTFPQERYAFIDVFSCKEFDVEAAKQWLSAAFGAKRVTTALVKRGLDFPRRLDFPKAAQA